MSLHKLDKRVPVLMTPEQKKAIYGAGFYGGYIATKLKNMQNVKCFLDQNPHRQGISFFEKPILSLADMPNDIDSILVGLNPATAQKSISEVKDILGPEKDFFFL